MFIGVKDGRAVGVQGDPDHPVNVGLLCPKGLVEHETIHADTRARFPLLRRERGLERVSWDEAIGTMASRFDDIQRKYGRDAVGIISTGQLTEEFPRGKLAQLGSARAATTGTTYACPGRLRLQAVVRQRRSSGHTGLERRRRAAHRREHRRQPSDSVAAPFRNRSPTLIVADRA
jgi:anaerobic selenocysteine-containing dehydrogenase